MAKATSMSLGDHFDAFIARQIKSGRYGSASEVVREGLRILEDREAKLATLRAALVEGEQSGIDEDFTLDALNAEIDQELQKAG